MSTSVKIQECCQYLDTEKDMLKQIHGGNPIILLTDDTGDKRCFGGFFNKVAMKKEIKKI